MNKKMQANSDWLYIVPRGMYGVIHYIKEKYGNPTVIITENGNKEIFSTFLTYKNDNYNEIACFPSPTLELTSKQI